MAVLNDTYVNGTLRISNGSYIDTSGYFSGISASSYALTHTTTDANACCRYNNTTGTLKIHSSVTNEKLILGSTNFSIFQTGNSQFTTPAGNSITVNVGSNSGAIVLSAHDTSGGSDYGTYYFGSDSCTLANSGDAGVFMVYDKDVAGGDYTGSTGLKMKINQAAAGTIDFYGNAINLNGTAVSLDGHTHSYLPLSGGTMTGTITAKVAESDVGIKLGNTYLNAIDGSIIFQNNSAIRFGTNSWDWNCWAGLGYDHSNKIVSLGIANNETGFTVNSNQYGGTLKLPGIETVQIGYRHSSSSQGKYTWLTLVPYFHTGGPFRIKSADDSQSAYIDINYDNTSIISFRHQGDISTNGSVYASSDRRLKCNFKKPDLNPLKVINQLKLTEFNFKSDNSMDDKYYGLIAQNLLKVLPNKYKNKLVNKNLDGMYTINEGKFPYILLGGIQELSKQNKKLQKENTKLKEEIRSLKKDIKAIKKALNLE